MRSPRARGRDSSTRERVSFCSSHSSIHPCLPSLLLSLLLRQKLTEPPPPLVRLADGSSPSSSEMEEPELPTKPQPFLPSLSSRLAAAYLGSGSNSKPPPPSLSLSPSPLSLPLETPRKPPRLNLRPSLVSLSRPSVLKHVHTPASVSLLALLLYLVVVALPLCVCL